MALGAPAFPWMLTCIDIGVQIQKITDWTDKHGGRNALSAAQGHVLNLILRHNSNHYNPKNVHLAKEFQAHVKGL